MFFLHLSNCCTSPYRCSGPRMKSLLLGLWSSCSFRRVRSTGIPIIHIRSMGLGFIGRTLDMVRRYLTCFGYCFVKFFVKKKTFIRGPTILRNPFVFGSIIIIRGPTNRRNHFVFGSIIIIFNLTFLFQKL